MVALADAQDARKLRIRPARSDEALTLGRVHVASWQTAYRGILPDSYLDTLSVSRRAEMWQDLLMRAEPGTFNLVAEAASGAVIGFASGGPARAEIPLPEPTGDTGAARKMFDGELYAIYLLAEHRGRGVGRSLAVALAREMAAVGYRSMLVWVLAANPAYAFYEALGAVRVGEEEISIADLTLPELAYGWPDLAALAGQSVSGMAASS